MVELGKLVSEDKVDRLRKGARNFRFVIPPKDKWRKEFDDYVFVSEDNGESWLCVKNANGSLLVESSATGHVTPDRRKSRDYYTRFHTTSGGRPEFNPVSGTGSRYGKKSL